MRSESVIFYLEQICGANATYGLQNNKSRLIFQDVQKACKMFEQ